MVQAVNPRARCVAIDPPAGTRFAWDVVVDRVAAPAVELPEAAMVGATGTARFLFADPGLRD